MTLAQSDRLASTVADALAPFCERIEIAGSVRRRRPVVNDIDIVAIPRDLPGLKARCRRNGKITTDGSLNVIVELSGGVQIDIFLADPPREGLLGIEPTNWGTLLLCRTGSKEHNVWLASEAKRRGLHWNPYKGIYRGYDIIASETEQDIYKAIGLSYIEPTKRER